MKIPLQREHGYELSSSFPRSAWERVFHRSAVIGFDSSGTRERPKRRYDGDRRNEEN